MLEKEYSTIVKYESFEVRGREGRTRNPRWRLDLGVKIGTGIGTIPAGFLADSIAVERWPVGECMVGQGGSWSPGSDSERKWNRGNLSRENKEGSKRNGSRSRE